jgi:hypothetical protein
VSSRSRPPFARRVLTSLGLVGFGVVAALIVLAVVLQLGALYVRATGRETAGGWLTSDVRVPCTGDSNTCGHLVEPDEAYPKALERDWNERHDRRPIEVVNVGYPVTAAQAGPTAEPAPGAPPVEVKADWSAPGIESKTTASLQVVLNPLFRPQSPMHDRVFGALERLQADDVRFVPWMPYPKLGVAELEPPGDKGTSWDFSLIDPLVVDFMRAMGGRRAMVSFSVVPQWMFVTDEPVAYPSNPDEITWSYQQGTELRDPSGKELADYYARLASWYTRGGFVDERGKRHDSPHHFSFDAWEVFNEPNTEHEMKPEQYVARYDAIVDAVRAVAPKTRFAGPAVSFPLQNLPFFTDFLDPAHHRPGIPIDVLTYHFYVLVPRDRPAGACPSPAFQQNDKFAAGVSDVEAIRARFRPAAETAINEIGAIIFEELSPDKPDDEAKPIEDGWWNLSAALFAHQFATLSLLGIEVVGQSALAQYPGQFPSVSMLDWKTGRPNARYWVLDMIKNHFGRGDRLVPTVASTRRVHAQGFVTRRGERAVLIVNKCDGETVVGLPGLAGARSLQVDTAFDPPAAKTVAADGTVRLAPFGVAIVTAGSARR